MREISYQVRHVVTLPDEFPETDEPTVLTVEEMTNATVWSLIADLHGGSAITVTTRGERLDK